MQPLPRCPLSTASRCSFFYDCRIGSRLSTLVRFLLWGSSLCPCQRRLLVLCQGWHPVSCHIFYCRFLFSDSIISVFRDDPDVIRIGIVALRFQLLTFPTCAFMMMSNMMMQTIRKLGVPTSSPPHVKDCSSSR